MSSRKFTAGRILAVAGLSFGILTSAAPVSEAAVTKYCPPRHACVWQHLSSNGERQAISGYQDYQDLNSLLHDQATSWRNTNINTSMAIGDWRNGKMVIGQVLRPGWVQNDLRKVNFDDTADFVKQSK